MKLTVERKQYASYNVAEYLDQARRFAKNKIYLTRSKVIRFFAGLGIDIDPKVAAAIIYRIGYVTYTRTTYKKEGGE